MRKQPVLAAGDLIRVNDSILSGSINVLNEFKAPLLVCTQFIRYSMA